MMRLNGRNPVIIVHFKDTNDIKLHQQEILNLRVSLVAWHSTILTEEGLTNVLGNEN